MGATLVEQALESVNFRQQALRDIPDEPHLQERELGLFQKM